MDNNEAERKETERPGGAAEGAELTPEDINGMTPEEFGQYLDSLETAEEPYYAASAGDDTPENGDDTPYNGGDTPDTGDDTPENGDDTPGTEDETGGETNAASALGAGTAAPPTVEAEAAGADADRARYETELRRRISAAVEQDRKQRGVDDETLRRIEGIARYYYGSEPDPMKAMADYIEKTAAEQDGVDINEQRRRMENEQKARRYDDISRRAAERDAQRRRIYDTWTRDAAQLKYVVPDFDFKTAMQDPAFRSELMRGKSIAEAYMSVNTPPQAAPPKRTAVRQNAQERRQPGTGDASVDPSTLPPQEFMKYINKIKEA